jgi:hypothetical protein
VHAIDERTGDLCTRLVAVRVDNSVLGVGSLTTELEVTGWIEVEMRTGCLELADARWSFLYQHLHRFGIAQRRSRGQSITTMQLGRVAGAERGGDPTLSVRRRAVEERSFGQQQYVTLLGGTPSGM